MQESETALDSALNIGYRHIDTAYTYENEELIGRTLKSRINSGSVKREDLFIVTKVSVPTAYQNHLANAPF